MWGAGGRCLILEAVIRGLGDQAGAGGRGESEKGEHSGKRHLGDGKHGEERSYLS